MKRWTLLSLAGTAFAFVAALAATRPEPALGQNPECGPGPDVCDTIYIPVCVEWQMEPFMCLRYENMPWDIPGYEDGSPWLPEG